MSHDVTDHRVRVAALGVQIGVGIIFRDAPEPVLLVLPSRPPQMLRQQAGDPRGGAPVDVSADAPAPRPGDRRHDIEPVRPPVVARPVTPRFPASSTSIRRYSWRTSARTVNAPPCREALCTTALVANPEATRIASSCGPPSSHPASADPSPDLFAVSVILYELLCNGHHPYPNRMPVVYEPMIDPRTIRPELTQSLRSSS
jgi:hypothetical protein